MSLEDIRCMSLDDLTDWLAFFKLREEHRQKEERQQAIKRKRVP